jgi:23S rRNA pseudouridine1911/1915/1917 synthase
MTDNNPGSTELILTVGDEGAGARLDRWLAGELPQRSRSEIQRWIKDGRVRVDGVVAKASRKLEPGQVVHVSIPQTVPAESVQPEAIPLDILYEDDDLIVINKPAGMVVHPSPGHASGTLVNAILHHCPDIKGVGGERRPGIVHRLDKETSGVMVAAKNDRAHRDLQTQFKERTIYKEYLALLEGRLDPPAGRIDAPLGRHPTDRVRQAILPPDPVTGVSRGRDAVTEYHTLAVYSAPIRGGSAATGLFTLARVILHTGRTHQIRVHFAWRKHPVVGDTLYGYKRQRLELKRQFLHAHKLGLRLPGNGSRREFTAPLPPDLQAVLEYLENTMQ